MRLAFWGCKGINKLRFGPYSSGTPPAPSARMTGRPEGLSDDSHAFPLTRANRGHRLLHPRGGGGRRDFASVPFCSTPDCWGLIGAIRGRRRPGPFPLRCNAAIRPYFPARTVALGRNSRGVMGRRCRRVGMIEPGDRPPALVRTRRRLPAIERLAVFPSPAPTVGANSRSEF